MADAWGRLTDEPAVALVTAGPGPLQRGLRALHRAHGRVADGAAERPRTARAARPRRLPGGGPGRGGGAGGQGLVDGEGREPARRGHHRRARAVAERPARAGPREPARRSARGQGRRRRARARAAGRRRPRRRRPRRWSACSRCSRRRGGRSCCWAPRWRAARGPPRSSA